MVVVKKIGSRDYDRVLKPDCECQPHDRSATKLEGKVGVEPIDAPSRRCAGLFFFLP
ncbi:hypothetical protein M378DRAFT_154761 [Amanita muscaria Koide BX008]|uniref:Uncharacterized protein n=1 Tax=Amanita muscaria (strain Koide BX008) TaxID=946122 RepID=A0A0C2T5N7_AMAMK|nr:hypothetical protein M378DRAFT_154761 [Amanita muscaria Koide BX008]